MSAKARRRRAASAKKFAGSAFGAGFSTPQPQRGHWWSTSVGWIPQGVADEHSIFTGGTRSGIKVDACLCMKMHERKLSCYSPNGRTLIGPAPIETPLSLGFA